MAETTTLPPVTIGQVTRVILTAMRDLCQDELELIAAQGMQGRYSEPPADEGNERGDCR